MVFDFLKSWKQIASEREAMEAWIDAAKAWREHGDWLRAAKAYENAGDSFEAEGEIEKAIDEWINAAEVLGKIREPEGLAVISEKKARAMEKLERFDAAVEAWREAVDAYTDAEKNSEAVAARNEQKRLCKTTAELYERNGDWFRAGIVWSLADDFERAAVAFEMKGAWEFAIRMWERAGEPDRVKELLPRSAEIIETQLLKSSLDDVTSAESTAKEIWDKVDRPDRTTELVETIIERKWPSADSMTRANIIVELGARYNHEAGEWESLDNNERAADAFTHAYFYYSRFPDMEDKTKEMTKELERLGRQIPKARGLPSFFNRDVFNTLMKGDSARVLFITYGRTNQDVIAD